MLGGRGGMRRSYVPPADASSYAQRQCPNEIAYAGKLCTPCLLLVVEAGAQRELEEVVRPVLRDEHVVEQPADLVEKSITGRQRQLADCLRQRTEHLGGSLLLSDHLLGEPPLA
jgi:hypothetical protein